MKKKRFTSTFDTDLIKQAKILAINLDVSVNKLIEEGLEHVLKKHRKKENDFNSYGQHDTTNKKPTRADREDITTVDTVLPIRNLTEV